MRDREELFESLAEGFIGKYFQGMPKVPVYVSVEWEELEPQVAAKYLVTERIIVISREWLSYFKTAQEIENVIKHELIHAWLHWKNIDQMGKFLDKSMEHSQWFVKKALEVGVDVQYLLTTPEAVQIYNQVAWNWTAPHLRHESTDWPSASKGTKDSKATKDTKDTTTEKDVISDQWFDGFDKVHDDYERRLNEVEKGSLEWHQIQATWKHWQETHDPEDPGAFNPFKSESYDTEAFNKVWNAFQKKINAVPKGSPQWQKINDLMTDWLVHHDLNDPAGYKPQVEQKVSERDFWRNYYQGNYQKQKDFEEHVKRYKWSTILHYGLSSLVALIFLALFILMYFFMR